jgi:hypothetical protein
MRCNKRLCSITSSARASSVGGTVMPSDEPPQPIYGPCAHRYSWFQFNETKFNSAREVPAYPSGRDGKRCTESFEQWSRSTFIRR